MRIRSTLVVLTLLAGCAGLAAAQEAPGVSLACRPIRALPYTISSPGRYCLVSSLSFAAREGKAVNICADDVQLDLRGFTLDGRGAGSDTRAVGIYALNRRRIRVHDGTVAGFRYGVLLADASASGQGHVIDHVTALDSRGAGIAVTGVNATIRFCRVLETQGNGLFGVGIAQAGSGATVSDNTVIETVAGRTGGYAAGIDLAHGFGRRVSGNLVFGVFNERLSYGIRCGEQYLAQNLVIQAGTPASHCDQEAGDPDAYPYPYPYPFHLDTYPYPVARHNGNNARSGLGGPLLAGGGVAVLALLGRRRALLA